MMSACQDILRLTSLIRNFIPKWMVLLFWRPSCIQSCTSHECWSWSHIKLLVSSLSLLFVCRADKSVHISVRLKPSVSARACHNIAPSHQISLIIQSPLNQQNMWSYIRSLKNIFLIVLLFLYSYKEWRRREIEEKNLQSWHWLAGKCMCCRVLKLLKEPSEQTVSWH